MTATNHSTRLNAIALSGRVLGALFYYEPRSDAAAMLTQMLQTPGWENEWPLSQPVPSAIPAMMAGNRQDETLEQAHQRLFVGPWALPAPPWGSVWLDRENVLFGDSTLALRQWMQSRGVAHHSVQNEPEDQFGTLLMLAAWLADAGQQQALDELLAWHLLPWAPRFLACFVENAAHPFWQGLGELAQLTLADWRSGLPIPVVEKPLFR
ncbi:Tat proofreading chaperone DmsD [Enterobacteriaceae bacterium BIT-l23]|uniref:Tat proofreading chaperone DmsD n=1 Tax=Jejubacter sp. L23 TaxID=3092086 RepID=UPI0015850C73|nr:Tat proofreading chaperone DmsD [Enterobacteriaceae bacterium BIT-l23]